MLKCPVPDCSVVIAPKKGINKNLSNQKGALTRHLSGGKSTWGKCEGHNININIARQIADHVVEIAKLINDNI